MMDFARRLRELREKKGLTQAELGRLFNLSKQAISSYETGGSAPGPETLQRLADFFGVSLDWLLGRTDDPHLLGQTNTTQETEIQEKLPPQVKKIIHSLARAKELEDEDYDIIADQVNRLIEYAQKKKHSQKGKEK